VGEEDRSEEEERCSSCDSVLETVVVEVALEDLDYLARDPKPLELTEGGGEEARHGGEVSVDVDEAAGQGEREIENPEGDGQDPAEEGGELGGEGTAEYVSGARVVRAGGNRSEQRLPTGLERWGREGAEEPILRGQFWEPGHFYRWSSRASSPATPLESRRSVLAVLVLSWALVSVGGASLAGVLAGATMERR